MKKILLASCLLVLLSWVGNAVENSSAQPHLHKNIFSQSSGHEHHDKTAKTGKFNCPLHKHKSLAPCPHKHSQKEMAHPKQCKIGPDCGGKPFGSVPASLGYDCNPISTANLSHLNLPGNARAVSFLPVGYDDPLLNAKKHPPKSL